MQTDASIYSLGSVLWLAIALGLDGFSVSLSIGMQKIRLKRIAMIAVVMGVFHFLLPLIGMVLGMILSTRLDHITALVGSLLLVFIGAYMFFSALRITNRKLLDPNNTVHMVSAAFAVSLDSFPVGLSLGLYGMQSFLIMTVIGSVAMIFALLGMWIGRRFYGVFGIYSEILGGTIIFLYGLKGLF